MRARFQLAVVLAFAAAPAFAALAPQPVPDAVVIRELRQRLAVLEDATPRASAVSESRHSETIDQLGKLLEMEKDIRKLALASERAARSRGPRVAEQDRRADLARRLQVFDTLLALVSVALLTLLVLPRRRKP